MKIAFDIGGVLSKYPKIFKELIIALEAGGADVYIISDMGHTKISEMLSLNQIYILPGNIYSADYAAYGENCKKILCEELKIDIFVDDFIGYVAEGDFVRLLVMPNPKFDYYDESWKTDGSEGNFGRRRINGT